MSGLVVGFKGPTPDWYRDAPKLGEPWSDQAPTATRLKQVIESLRSSARRSSTSATP
jgi:hypothetical protein